MRRFATNTVSALTGLGGLALMAGPALADSGGYGGGYGWMHGGGYGFGMGLFGILAMIAVVIAVVWAVRAAGGPQGQSAHAAPSALEVLDKRYANGEVEREDYLARKKDLEGK